MNGPRLDLACSGRSIPEVIEFIKAGEKCGWGGAWVTEINGIDGVTLASSVASILDKARLGSAILPMQTRDPLLMAMTAASIGQVSKEGFILGLGTSTKIIIEDWHATPWGRSPLGLTREYVDLLRRFLSGERVTTESGRWRYKRSQLGIRPDHEVPIYLAALNDGMLELAGEIADGVILNFVSPADLKHARGRIAAGAERAGRSLDNFEYMIFFRASVTEDYETVRDRYQRELFTYVMSPVYQTMFEREGYGDDCKKIESMWRAGEREQALNAIPEPLIRDRVLIGSADEISSRLSEYVSEGLDTALTLPVPIPDRDYVTDTLRTIEVLSKNPPGDQSG